MCACAWTRGVGSGGEEEVVIAFFVHEPMTSVASSANDTKAAAQIDFNVITLLLHALRKSR